MNWQNSLNSRRLTIFVALSAAVVLSIISAGPFVSFLNKESKTSIRAASVHYYGDEAIPISQVKVKVVYFIPKDQVQYRYDDWMTRVHVVLDEMQKFHELQFRGRSHFSYEIYPTPVIGEEDHLFYDGVSTARGNPLGAKHVNSEVTRRFPDFFQVGPSEFLSKIYVYEGVGASEVGDAAILSRDYLSQTSYDGNRSSIFYHEFAHTLGAPEGYNVDTNVPFTPDIMGFGRFKPLRTTYLDELTKAAMGLR